MAARFSIITCTWNSQPWLAESIASVLMQDWPDIELIFVDGGSTDNTLAQINSVALSAGRPVKLIGPVQGGISNAMNHGLQAATGDIVAHLHSDDFYLRPDVLSVVAKIFAASGCRWLFGRIQRAVDGQLLPEGFTAPRYSRAKLLRGNFIPHPATFVKRDLMLEAGGFDTSLYYAMDYDLWLKLSQLAEPLQLDLPLAAFREHAGSLSTRNRIAAMHEDLQVRLCHTSKSPLERAMHYARFCVRRQRALQSQTKDQNA